MIQTILLVLCILVTSSGCGAARAPETIDDRPLPPGAQATSLLGDPLFPPPIAEAAATRHSARLAEARAAYAHTPDNVDSILWLGRRTAYPGQFREAIAIFSQGIEKHPGDARLYRHRGHRYITIRRFDLAVADLERAAALIRGKPDEIEPDGLPNARNIPTGTLQFNIWYHLGLARYLRGDFSGALDAYAACVDVSTNADMRVAASHWMYMTLRRMRREQDADDVLVPISRDMDIVEDVAYHRLLMLYKGEVTADSLVPTDTSVAISDVALAYGVATWHAYNGRSSEAARLHRRILATGQWPSFGFIAAEADVAAARSRGGRGR